MIKSEKLSTVKRHTTVVYSSSNREAEEIEEVPMNVTITTRITPINIPLLGLCSNCDQWRECHWKENHKLFCEHYY